MSVMNAFNGGELSPALQMRPDLDVFQRGCSCVDNFDIGQTGGVTRRRGFAWFAEAQSEFSRIFTYKYCNDACFLVEVGEKMLRVYTPEGDLVFEEESPYVAANIAAIRTLQINALLLFLNPYVPPLQLRCDAEGVWSLQLFSSKVPPWRFSEYRDWPVLVSRREDGYYAVEFDAEAPVEEASPEAGEVLRVSFFTEAAHIKGGCEGLFNRVDRHEEEGFLSAATRVAEGDVVAVRRSPEYAVYSTIADFKPDGFVDGLVDPANYTANFQISSDTTRFDLTISELSNTTSLLKGQRVRFEQGYWDLFTCIAEFDGERDFFAEGLNPEDYPGHFVRGLLVGSAPCKGTWNFYTSGTWYGSYDVRASYEGQAAASPWEHRGESFSRNAAPSNSPLAGDESDEVCHVSLWLTRVRAYGDSWSARNFPADSCGNVLTVNSYKHDMVLRFAEMVDEVSGEVVDGFYVLDSAINPVWFGSISSVDWSWCAFCSKYGFPKLACIFSSRLVFAATDAQPQTIWLSRTDDIDNFDVIENDAGAMALTMSGQTQDPIRWMAAQNNRIMIGTAEGEYVVTSGSNGVMTYANATIACHGFVGAADVDAIQASDKVIYFERGGGRVYQYGYDYAQDAFLSTDLSVFADHVLPGGGGVTEGTIIRKPYAKAALVLRDGSLALITYNSMHQVNAWHRYTTAGRFLSVAAMPDGNAPDLLFAVVAREVVREVAESELPDPTDMETRFYIERMSESSPYEDNGGNDYTSTLLTHSLLSKQLGSDNKSDPRISIYFQDASPAEGLEFTTDGGTTWSKPNRSRLATLPQGWYDDAAFANNRKESIVGFRVRGRRGLKVLAIQG